MEPTVLAGPIQFSPAEIAMIVSVLALLFVAVTAPGWVALAVASGRRSRAHGRRPWGARAAGAMAGLAISVVVTASTVAVFEQHSAAALVGIVDPWAICAALAALLVRHRTPQRQNPAGLPPALDAVDAPTGHDGTSSRQGWGR